MKLTTEQFILRSNIIHNNFYDYSLVNYNGLRQKVEIVCPFHGNFNQLAGNHLQGSGCNKCGNELVAKKQTLTTDRFITKANIIHNNFYDYSLTNYINNSTKVIISCPEHNNFTQIPNSHLNGNGCPACTNNKKITTEDFIKKGNTIHNNFYDYSQINVVNNKIKVTILCPIHGEFNQSAKQHLIAKSGCPKCAGVAKLTIDDFILKANTIHNNKYSYELVEYINAKTKIKIICPEDGIFEQQPTSHLRGHGCPNCKRSFQTSKGEKEVLEFIKSFYKNEIIENDRKLLNGKELDIYLPEINLAIEYNGEYWHDKREKEFPGYHQLKEDLCKEKGILLINILDKDWIKNNQDTKDKLIYTIKNKIDS